MALSKRDFATPIGVLRHAVFDDLGPSWLKFDGKTEYDRAMYPEFLARANGHTWLLAGSTTAKFKLVNVPAGTATVASGFSTVAGTMIGSDSVTLTVDNLPEHDHSYVDDATTMKTGTAGLLGGVLPIVTGSAPSSTPKRTGKTGASTTKPLPIKPPGFIAHLFVFAGRPRA